MTPRYNLSIAQEKDYTDIPLGPEGSAQLPLRAFISLRRAGNMNFQRRHELPCRNDLFAVLGFDGARVFSLVQKHTQDVIVVDERTSPESISETIADGLVTKEKTAILCVTVADCLPIFIADTRTFSFGAVHSGWKGTGIVMSAIRLMEEKLGSTRRDLRVVIGPGIGTCCYTVDKERAMSFASSFGESAIRKERYNFILDIRQANINLLHSEGIEDIMVCDDCTSCNPLLSSFRRDGKPDFVAMLAGIAYTGTGTQGAQR
jgi:YfiH family protein